MTESEPSNLSPGGRGITALLGPTNTGKTHLAIERMLAHRSGMIGFPLRLLARENYDRAVRLRGAHQVALITGEEKILPPGARYFFCTVESMPTDRQVEFLAVDEIQLCGDPERGHIFTERLLHARGIAETMFLGASTIKPLLQRLVPEAEVVSRPRFSTLSYAGERKLTRLPPRSAIVAFSAADVYQIAELIRRQRGGAAVVLGALSPRTRNAQVALFEAGEVDYLVATDAIGMGLNLHLDHVAFARLGKFDGREMRRLTPAEIGQIAGRAGRHMSDGTFGTTAELGGLDPALVEAVESHRFDPLRSLAWRNRSLDFSSVTRLLSSLEALPGRAGLYRAREAEDQLHLAALLKDPAVVSLLSDEATIVLLWDVCQIPDFQKTLTDQHNRLLARIFQTLLKGAGRLPEDWIAGQLKAIDRTDGEIDSLTARIARGRVWTFITHRGDWLDDSQGWQDRARAVEDRLSDALHQRLTQRFVDRKGTALLRRQRKASALLAGVRKDGEVVLEGEVIGRLVGFTFQPAEDLEPDNRKAAESAARRVLADEVPRRVQQLEQDDNGSFLLDGETRLTWRGHVVGRLVKGRDRLHPAVQIDEGDLLDGGMRERMRQRLESWVGVFLRNRLGPLFDLAEADVKGNARGLAYQLVESLGCLPRRTVASQVRKLVRGERQTLQAAGLRIGAESLFLPALLKPESQSLKALLWSLWGGVPLPPLPAPSEILSDSPAAESLLLACGWRRIAGRRWTLAVRVDVLERLSAALYRMKPEGLFCPTPALTEIVGNDREALSRLLPALSFQMSGDPSRGLETLAFAPKGHRGVKRKARQAGKITPAAPGAGGNEKSPQRSRKSDGSQSLRKRDSTPKGSQQGINPDSPFAKLAELYKR
ncbi:helicase-related protein [Limibacillus halophilus]|uniref:ATP-dependent RNA helicase SUPV3L1/SUV3 n=1 Tax=Limibacillus halophilus TaxID=1579333 RepID=A0A839SM50_9PROT|nr:helicase-related protein [Limibacillus halophilus]MBB3063977.1 ATP-dependent RNA helicase SUPV3L1/SUV3 [Limibacillus halophilus]